MWTLKGLARLEWLAPIALRAVIGVSFFLFHGMAKLKPGDTFDWGQAFVSQQSALAPAWMLYVAAWTEFFAGLGVLLGLLTRWAALGLLAVMAYAVFKVHWQNGFLASEHGYEVAAIYGVGCLALAVIGPGPLSLDRIFFGRGALNR